MELKKVTDEAFKKYGRVIREIDFTGLVEALNTKTPTPDDVVYEPSVPELETLPVYEELKTKTYGELSSECTGVSSFL